MRLNKPQPLARQLDYCDICHDIEHLYKLRLKTVRGLAHEAYNKLLYSSYNTSFWTCDATDEGTISVGVFGLEARTFVADDATATTFATVSEINGSQTWSGDGTIRSTTSVDISSATNIVFSFHGGRYHRESGGNPTFKFGFINAGGDTKYQQKSVALKGGSGRFWFEIDIADLPVGVTSSAAYFYVEADVADASYKWWADAFQLEVDRETPGPFVTTLGTAIDRSDTPTKYVAKVCPSCLDYWHRDSELYGDPYNVVEDPIEMDHEEN